MSDLVVFAFDNETGAKEMSEAVGRLQKQELIKLEDAATVVRKGEGKPKVKQAQSLVGAGALGGAFWGLLIGLLFFAPWLGLVAGAVGGALGGKLTDIGIDDKFMKSLADGLQPNTSVLFVLVRKATPDKVLDEIKQFGGTVLQTSLAHEDEAKLQAALNEVKQATA